MLAQRRPPVSIQDNFGMSRVEEVSKAVRICRSERRRESVPLAEETDPAAS
jgi:hypothetical protein